MFWKSKREKRLELELKRIYNMLGKPVIRQAEKDNERWTIDRIVGGIRG